MEQTVRVQKVFEDGTAKVSCIRQSACSGDCHQCARCGAAKEQVCLIAGNPIGARPGDLVTVSSDSGAVLRNAFVLYIIPLVMFFLGYCLGALLWKQGAAVGCAGFAAGIILAVVYDRRVVKRKKTEYRITGFAKMPES